MKTEKKDIVTIKVVVLFKGSQAKMEFTLVENYPVQLKGLNLEDLTVTEILELVRRLRIES